MDRSDVVGGRLAERADRLDPGVVGPHVDRTVFGLNPLDQPADLIGVAQVGAQVRSVAPRDADDGRSPTSGLVGDRFADAGPRRR